MHPRAAPRAPDARELSFVWHGLLEPCGRRVDFFAIQAAEKHTAVRDDIQAQCELVYFVVQAKVNCVCETLMLPRSNLCMILRSLVSRQTAPYYEDIVVQLRCFKADSSV